MNMAIRVWLGLVTVLALAVLASGPPALGKGREVRVAGLCTKASTSKLKLSEEDGRIEVEFEVDQNRNGVTWTVVLERGTRVLFRGTRTTRGPSGSFELRRLVSDLAGPDRIRARATRRGPETCRAAATF